MRIEFRNSGGETCPVCGSTKLLATSSGIMVEKDIRHLIFNGQPAFYRPWKRHWQKQLEEQVLEATRMLKELTREI